MGTKFIVEGTQEVGFVGDLVPEVAEALSWGALVSKQAVEDEIDTMLLAVRSFWDCEPDQVMARRRRARARNRVS